MIVKSYQKKREIFRGVCYTTFAIFDGDHICDYDGYQYDYGSRFGNIINNTRLLFR